MRYSLFLLFFVVSLFAQEPGPIYRLVDDRNYEKLSLFPERRPYFIELAEPRNLSEIEPFKSNPELLKQIYGFNFYREFEFSQPDQDLRFKCDLISRPIATEPGALYSDKNEFVATYKVNRPYTTWDEVGLYSPRPFDPSNPLPNRKYCYTVLLYKDADRKEYSEGEKSEWVQYALNAALAYDTDRKLSDPNLKFENSYTFLGDPCFSVEAIALRDQKRVVQERLPDYQQLLPDRKRRYLYKMELPGQCRYAVAKYADYPVLGSFACIPLSGHIKPGLLPATVTVMVDDTEVAARFMLNYQPGNWSYIVSSNTKRIQEEEKQLAKTDNSPQELSWIYSHIADSYMQMCDYVQAENAAKQSLKYAEAAKSDLRNNYSLLAEIYYHWGKHDLYLGMRRQEIFEASKDKTINVGQIYDRMARDYFDMTGNFNAAREFMAQAMQTSPAAQMPPEWLPLED